MDIKATNCNRIFYHLDDGICHLLMTAFPESFEQVNTPPKPVTPKPKQDEWSVGRHAISAAPMLTHTTRLGEIRPYTGDPAKAEATFNGWGSPAISLGVLDAYKRLWDQDHAPRTAENQRRELENAMSRQNRMGVGRLPQRPPEANADPSAIHELKPPEAKR